MVARGLALGMAFATGAGARKLLGDLPLHCASRRAGWLLLATLALGDAIALVSHFQGGPHESPGVALAISLIVAFGTALLIGWRRHRTARVVPSATLLGVGIGALPVALASSRTR